jgi:hypothetical protein
MGERHKRVPAGVGRICNWIHALLPDGVFTVNLK